MTVKNIVKFKGKKNRIALISGSGELPKLIIRELTLNGIEPIIFSPIGLKVNIPGSIDRAVHTQVLILENMDRTVHM